MAQSEFMSLFPASFEAEVMLQPGASIGPTGTNAGAKRRYWPSMPNPEGIALYTYSIPATLDVTALLEQDPPVLANSLMQTSMYLSGTTRAKGVVSPWATPVQALLNPEIPYGPARTVAALKLIASLGGSTTLAPLKATGGSATLVGSFTHEGKTGPIKVDNLLHFAQERALLETAADFIEDYNAADNFGNVEVGATEAEFMNIDFEAHPMGITYRLVKFPVSFF